MRAALFGLLVCGAVACDEARSRTAPEPEAPHTGQTAQNEKAPPLASSATDPAARASAPWFVGQWQGNYDVGRHPIERPSVQVAWVRDDGTRYAGAGTLTFEVGAEGRLRGTAEGALGAQTLVGAFDTDALTFELLGGASPEATNGVAKCERPHSDGDILCTIRASTGDGNFVRAGSVRLRQVPTQLP